MEIVLKGALILVGLINGYPVIGAFGSSAIQSLYGVAVEDSNLLMLLRHRAVLLGLLGGFLILAAFDKNLYLYAVIAGLVSMLTYIIIGFSSASYNAAIGRVIIIDIGASIILALAYLLYFFTK